MEQFPKADTTRQTMHCKNCGRWPAPDTVHGDHYCERCAGQFLTPDRVDPSQLPRTSAPGNADAVGESPGQTRVTDNHRRRSPVRFSDRRQGNVWRMLHAR